MVASCNNDMHAEESLGMRLEKSDHMIEHHMYMNNIECGNLQAVILEVKVMMDELLECEEKSGHVKKRM